MVYRGCQPESLKVISSFGGRVTFSCHLVTGTLEVIDIFKQGCVMEAFIIELINFSSLFSAQDYVTHAVVDGLLISQPAPSDGKMMP